MGWFIFLLIVVAVVVAFFWAKRHFRQEIERAKRINRANRNQSHRPGGTQARRARARAWYQ